MAAPSPRHRKGARRARETPGSTVDLIVHDHGCVPEYEQASIIPYYYWATGESDKRIEAYQLAIRNYPRDWKFHNNLGVAYVDLGRYEEALKEGLEAVRLEPNVEPPYRRQLDAYMCLDRLPEAKRLAERLRAQRLDGPRIHQRFREMAYVEDDQAAIGREIQWFAGKPEEYLSFGLQAAHRNVHGQRSESHKLYQRAAEGAPARLARPRARLVRWPPCVLLPPAHVRK